MYTELKLAVSPLLFPNAGRSELSPDGVYHHTYAKGGQIGYSIKDQKTDGYNHFNRDSQYIGRSGRFSDQCWYHVDATGKSLGTSMHIGQGDAFHHYDADKKEIGYSIRSGTSSNVYAHHAIKIDELIRPVPEPKSELLAVLRAAREEVGVRVAEFVARHPKINPALRKALNFISQKVA